MLLSGLGAHVEERERTLLYIDLISYIVICESAFPRDSMRSMVASD